MAGPRIEPYVENIVLLAERTTATVSANRTGGHQLRCASLVPDVGGMLGKELHHAVENLSVGQRMAAGIAVEDNDRYPPNPLARNAPVRTVSDHVVDPLFAPGGIPLHMTNGFERFLTQIVTFHPDKPLLSGTEYG